MSKNNGGLLINPQTGSSLFTVEELPLNIRYSVSEYSEENFNNGKPFIIAAHSQGALHGQRL